MLGSQAGHPGQCRYCMKGKQNVFSIQRFGGGSYKRAGRYFTSSICLECCVELVKYIGDQAQWNPGNFSGRSIQQIVRDHAPEAAS